jgi:hypothetical protein
MARGSVCIMSIRIVVKGIRSFATRRKTGLRGVDRGRVVVRGHGHEDEGAGCTSACSNLLGGSQFFVDDSKT